LVNPLSGRIRYLITSGSGLVPDRQQANTRGGDQNRNEWIDK